MTPAFQHNVGAFVALVTSVLPQSTTGATLTGAAIDRFAHNTPLSCVLHQVTGASTGSPTGISVQSTLQHSPDNSTWTSYTPDGASSAAESVALTAASAQNSLPIDLSGAYRYIRPSTVAGLTGGSSPAIELAVNIVLGGEALLPAA